MLKITTFSSILIQYGKLDTFSCGRLNFRSNFTAFLCVFIFFKISANYFPCLDFSYLEFIQSLRVVHISSVVRWCNLFVYISGTCAKVINFKFLSILPSNRKNAIKNENKSKRGSIAVRQSFKSTTPVNESIPVFYFAISKLIFFFNKQKSVKHCKFLFIIHL